MLLAHNKRKRKNNTRSSAVNSNKNSKQTLSESSEKTQSDSGSDKLQCNKTKKLIPTPQSDSDNDTKHTTPAPKLIKNAHSEHPTSTQANMTQKPMYNIHTSNSYETLNGEDIDNMEQDVDEHTQKPPPPIIIHSQIKNHKTLVQQIQNTGDSTFTIKYTKNTTNITIHDRKQRLEYMNTLKNENTEFHTYTDKPHKTHSFVIRGLAEDVTPDEVMLDLKTNYNITAINCHIMKFERHNTKPLILLITDSTHTLSNLQNKVHYIAHTKIQIERRRNTRKTVQCHNCQNWGHATSNCHANTRCMHCAGPHHTKVCQIKNKPKCANCKNEHAANDPKCTKYTDRIKWMEERRNKQKKNHHKTQY